MRDTPVFESAVIKPDSPPGESLCFGFQGGKMLVCQDAGIQVPRLSQLGPMDLPADAFHYLGRQAHTHCFAVALALETALPAGFELHELRTVAMALDAGLFTLAGMARQVLLWDQNHRFCGRCGNATVDHPRDRAKVCPACGHSQYPRISPCIIVLITRGDEILLARSARFPSGLYSTLAGFVEPGETLEHAVHREIREEVGVTVRNLSYRGSQPWPFPHSLMMGFRAEYAGGDIVLEDDEIVEAGWWHVRALPPIPPAGSISHQLITDYVAEKTK
ncbi:MAG: NAD(+) diphosphatase [Pseudomonadales bacterium]|nr:NAD(+) diphosphatase [Pseudomonadales bacterium]